MDKNANANRLINSTSPYLLQHAYNPVDWLPWGNEAFIKAQKEDKPIILSIGYSSCHWCHVMERESFENDDVAKVMNDNFVSIKVDREERPDVDQIYMDAVQAMGANGGWPLNVFLTPDLKPFYGGTYFPAQQWTQLLQRIATIYSQQKEEIEESSNQVVEALSTSEIKKYHLSISEEEFSPEILNNAFQKLATRFDNVYGGVDKAPKFPMPSIWLFLLNYAVQEKSKIALDHLKLTLDKMAAGGLYDQAGGGFARYSTDKQWFAPHFEKMLYDNGQLLSVYAQAYTVTKEPFYKDVIYGTVEWLEREMQHPDGAFYSALDADSEAEEGKFYVFTIEEIESALLDDQVVLAKTYFNIKPDGNWEHGNNILHAETSPEDFARVKDLKPDEIRLQLNNIRKALLEYRSERTRPGLDDKILTSWNALLISGLADAYKATGDDKFIKLALNATAFINDKMINEGNLLRSFNKNEARINAFLEDYATFIQALIKFYEVTFDEKHLIQAKDLTDKVIKDFFDEKEGMFFYTSKDSESLIARKKEIFDNVIPSSNSVMGINLYLLSLYFDDKEYYNISDRMLRRVSRLIPDEPSYLSNWGILYQMMSTPTAEIIIVGDKVEEIHKEINSHFITNKIIAGSKNDSSLPILQNRIPVNGKTTIYVCYDKACKLPVHTVNEAIKQLH